MQQVKPAKELMWAVGVTIQIILGSFAVWMYTGIADASRFHTSSPKQASFNLPWIANRQHRRSWPRGVLTDAIAKTFLISRKTAEIQ
jgi:hypothetical protein